MNLDSTAVLIMVGLCMIWGSQQVAIKAVAGMMSPTLQAALRSGIAALLVWGYSRFIAKEQWLRGTLLPEVIAGLLFASEFFFLSNGLRWTSAGHVAVFLYTAPLFAAIGLHLRLPEERLSLRQWLGVSIAFAGIVIAFLGRGSGLGEDWLRGDLFGLCGGAAWGLTTVVIRTTRLSEAPATQTLFCQLLTAFLTLFPLAWFTGQNRFDPGVAMWLSLGFQALVVSFVSYLTWFRLLKRYLAARLGILSFMTPVFGVWMGHKFLHEPVDLFFFYGSATVLGGLLVVNWPDSEAPSTNPTS